MRFKGKYNFLLFKFMIKEIRPAIINGKKPSCDFCNPHLSPGGKHFLEYGPNGRLDLAPLIDTEHMLVLPDILPVNPDGHAILIPKAHILSLAQWDGFSEETGKLIYQVEEKLKFPLTIFEHGGVSEIGNTHQSKVHAHMHLIANRQDFNIIELMKYFFKNKGIFWQEIALTDSSPPRNLRHLFQGRGYIYVQQGRSALIAHENGTKFPSLVTQGLTSVIYSNRELNWKTISKDSELAKLSIQRIVDIRKKCQL